MSERARLILLVQLPIPPLGGDPIRGNVPLAAGYLKWFAQNRRFEQSYQVDILPARIANEAGDRALVEEILDRRPFAVGFSCYLWNIDRTLWLATRLKERQPELVILLGGPEITLDNAWVLSHPAVDFAVIGEGEQTFADWLEAVQRPRAEWSAIQLPGLVVPGAPGPFVPRQPLPQLDLVSSPYLHGILDAADESMLLLETIRGCIFKCKFCFYPKSYDSLYFLSADKIAANLRHARERGATEVILLDPTLNQRRNFPDFLRQLIDANRQRQFTYFGELRAEGITPEIARLLADAPFTEVEIGLQSIDPLAMDLMDRRNHLKAFERGVAALLDVGIQVKVDLIIGLPGDTPDSIRRGLHYLRERGLYTSLQVFNLAILPGTAFREEATALGLRYSPRTPYYVVSTPTLATADLYELMGEAQELFDLDFDPLPAPSLGPRGSSLSSESWIDRWEIDLDADSLVAAPAASRRSSFFRLDLSSRDFDRTTSRAIEAVREVLRDNPHATLQVLLDVKAGGVHPSRHCLEQLWSACLAETSYLDRFYSILPGPLRGAKRLVVRCDTELAPRLSEEAREELELLATWVDSRPAAVESNREPSC